MYGQVSPLPVVAKTTVEPPYGANTPFAAEEIISIEFLRIHTKTEDVPTVTDEQIALYRDYAIESAQQYTGLLLNEQRTVVEDVRLPRNYSHDTRRTFKHHTAHPVANPNVYIYGPGIQGNTAIAIAEVGSRVVRMPNVFFAYDYTPCCLPCGSERSGFNIMYRAGYDCVARIPAGIKLGIAKLVAWSITNPGDVMRTVNDLESIRSNSLQGTNNAVYASGALDLWRQYVVD
jgi:hypothetical protein